MKKSYLIVSLMAVSVLAIVHYVMKIESPVNNIYVSHPNNLIEKNMKITSSAFSDNQKIPSQFTCDGDNVNPPLSFSNVPEQARSLVLIIDDPDAPNGTWTHWTLWNISPDDPGIETNSVPIDAVEGTTSFGKPGYGGPCPPSGTHRYFFKLYALDTRVNLPSEAKVKELTDALEGHVLDQVELVGLYSKN